MEINEIVEQLKYYTEDLPKEALKEAIKHKEEITPKLLEMLEYTKNNLEKIYYEEDDFFGYTYAIFLLAEFKETRAFPYLIDLINRDKEENEDIVDYIIGDDYPEYLPRLLASTYNGDDKALFDIIENTDLNEFVRSSVLQTFAILYLNGIKDRDFIVTYFKKLLDDKKEEDNSYLYEEIFVETEHLRLIELDGIIDKTFNLIEDKEEIQELKDVFANKNYKINRNIYPFKPCYEYIYDTIGIMKEWQCFRYREDEEYEQSDDNKVCEYIIFNRANNIENNHDLGRNDLCYCGSGKKYKKCCMNKDESKDIEKLDFIDHCISKAEWYLKRKEMKKGQALYKMAWFDVKDICKENNIKSISEYDEKYEGYDSLLNWLQDYDNLLEMCDEEDKLYERLELWDSVEEIFDLSNEINLYWKERTIREKANTEFRLGNEEKATKIIEEYLNEKENWVWGYIEMADWYDNKRDEEHYNLEKAKNILLKTEQIKDIEDMDAVYERLESIYDKLGDKEKSKEYDKKWNEYVHRK